MVTIRDYNTKQVLGLCAIRDFSLFCNRFNFWPHHKVGRTWYVITK